VFVKSESDRDIVSASIRQVNAEPIIEVLRCAAPDRSVDLDKLVAELRPRFFFDSDEPRILFQADAESNTIVVGVKCTCRLQAHAYAYAVMLSVQATPGYREMSLEERVRLCRPADHFLNWAAARDLQQWLARIEGRKRSLEEILKGEGVELPDGLIGGLSVKQRALGEKLFRLASAFILLHELAHLHFGHRACKGTSSKEQEKDADRFAAEWLMRSPLAALPERSIRLFGIAVALLWLTVADVFLGPQQSDTHPAGYDRLYQALDLVVDRNDENEELLVWHFVADMLLCCLHAANIQIDAGPTQGSPRDWVNYLIDMISKRAPW
jgi:hypothetical protein